jgi:hypothetical protein
MNDPGSRIMRLKLILEEFDYTIVYKRGKENSNSDGLCRMYTGTEKPTSECIRVVTEEKGVTVEEQEVKNKELSSKEKMEILREMHDSPVGGHVGINRTYEKLRHFIDWEGMKRDVEE